MKTSELLETKLQVGKYQIPWSWPNRSHRGFERIYNYVWPELAATLGVPVRNVKFSGWSPEKGTFKIKITNPKTEVDMVMLMAPKAVASLLAKAGFENVKITDTYITDSKATPSGKIFQIVGVEYTLEYSQKWTDWDAERFGRK